MQKWLWILFFSLITFTVFTCKSGKTVQETPEETGPAAYPVIEGEWLCDMIDPAPDLRETDLYQKTKHIRIVRYSFETGLSRQRSELTEIFTQLDSGAIALDELGSVTELNKLARERLFELIYGYKTGTRPRGLCYFPGHLILFENMFHRRIHHLEISFRCSKVETDLPELEIQCGKQFRAYADLFTTLGIAP